MTKTYRSSALTAIQETTADLHEVGLVDKCTMRRFDELCLTPIEKLSPEEIKAIRESARISQAVFARYLDLPQILIPLLG